MRTMCFWALWALGCSSDTPSDDKTDTGTAASPTSSSDGTPPSVDWSNHPILTGDLKVVAHRGGGLEAPENTLEALRASARLAILAAESEFGRLLAWFSLPFDECTLRARGAPLLCGVIVDMARSHKERRQLGLRARGGRVRRGGVRPLGSPSPRFLIWRATSGVGS